MQCYFTILTNLNLHYVLANEFVILMFIRFKMLFGVKYIANINYSSEEIP